jgi:DNA-binding GntR family transcriptional regulator
MDDEAQQPRSLTAQTYERLRAAIVSARFQPGEKLRIDFLRKEFAASSGAIREALSRLTSEGLVVAEPQRGFLVAPVSRQDLTDLTDVRIHVECRCLASAIRDGDLAWEGRVLSASHQLSALGRAYLQTDTPESRSWHALHQVFHDELTSACENSWWLRLRRQLYIQSERYRRLSGPFAETDRDIPAEHRAIAAAALDRDVDAATQAMADHLRATTEILLGSKILFADAERTRKRQAGVFGGS